MADNINGVPDNTVNVQKEPAKKKVRIGYIFLSVVPVAAVMAIQTLAQVPFLMAATVETMTGENVPADAIGLMDYIMTLFTEKYAAYSYLVYSVIGVAVFAFWYYKGFVKKKPKVRLREVFGVRSVTAGICIAVSLFFAINAALTLVSWLFPKLIESYNEILESAGIISDPVLTIIYGIILGPILEELCFRGVVFGFLEKTGARPWICILISSIFFGAMHLIPVQVAYATVLALFFGFLRYKYRSVLISIVTHILFNLMGTYVSEALDGLELGDGVIMIAGGIALIVLVFAVVFVNRDKKAVHM
ncbi:MAG: CPBP family intramembrane metalloprotease [Clostridiales bacterium]|nr:CPBP family intramembrane metalloprotease [Clostridiales bacterium]